MAYNIFYGKLDFGSILFFNFQDILWFKINDKNRVNPLPHVTIFLIAYIESLLSDGKAALVLILLHGCTTWALTKRMEKKLDSNYTRMLRAILNKSLRQHSTKQQLYDHLPPI